MGLPSPLRSAHHPLEVRCFGSLKPAALDSPSSSLYYLLCSSRENLFAFCAPYKNVVFVSWFCQKWKMVSFFFSFSYLDYIHKQEGKNASLCNYIHTRSPILSFKTFFSILKIKHIYYRKFRT